MLPFDVDGNGHSSTRDAGQSYPLPNTQERVLHVRLSKPLTPFQTPLAYPTPRKTIGGSRYAFPPRAAIEAWRPKADAADLAKTAVVVVGVRGSDDAWSLAHRVLGETPRAWIVDDHARVSVVEHDRDRHEARRGRAERVGWSAALAAAVHAIRRSRVEVDRFLFLDHDLEISQDFVSGVVLAERDTSASIVAASYNGPWQPQTSPHVVAGARFLPQPKYIATSTCDSVCFSVRREALRRGEFPISAMTERAVAMTDFCLSAASRGHTVAIARTAFAERAQVFTRWASELPHADQGDETDGGELASLWGADWKERISRFAPAPAVVYTFRRTLAPLRRVPVGWRFVCFTDDANLACEGWEVIHTSRSALGCKLHPHVLFPNCERSIWIDEECEYLPEWEQIAWALGRADMAVYPRRRDLLARHHHRAAVRAFTRAWRVAPKSNWLELARRQSLAISHLADSLPQTQWLVGA